MKINIYISIIIGVTLAFWGESRLHMPAPDIITVFAGQDRTMCFNQNLIMTDLNASIHGDVNNGDWLTFGDGRFQPGNLLTVRYSVAQSNQIMYVPGPNDRALGTYRLLLMSDAPVNNPQERGTDEVRISFQNAPPLFCSNNINISLNESCTQKVDATMLQPNPVPPYSNYIITLYDATGKIITNNILTKDHVDKEITYKLGHQCTSNFCWGKFKVEDYFPPVFVCKNDTIPCTRSFSPDSIGFPIPVAAYVDTVINNKFIVKNWDACSDVTLEYTDLIIKAECKRDEDKTISRRWKATDAKGNTSICTTLVVVKRMSLAQVYFPPNYDGHANPALECGEDFPALANGYPSPDTTGAPLTGHCGNLQFNYSDVPFSLCGQSYKIARSWFVIDWCTSASISKNQIIHVKDSKGPEIICQDSIVLNAGAYGCAADRVLIPGVLEIYDCSGYTATYALYNNQGIGVNQFLFSNQGLTYFEKLPVGSYHLEYIITDACQNSSVCSSTVLVEDNSPPYPACDAQTKVSLDANGRGRVFAVSLDDGSTDNCGIATFKVRKMTDQCGFGLQFGDYIDFCCAELGQSIMVALEVSDIYGNKNTCMVEVKVEDKLKPTLTCPPDITLACTDNYDFTQLDIFGKVVTNPAEVKDIVINNFYHQGKVGKDGLAKDNCNVTVNQSYKTELACHTGFIFRTFVATDAQGLKDSCRQKITILNPDPFDLNDIKWPAHYTADGCKSSKITPDITGVPTFSNTVCSNVTHSYDDTPFYIADSACVKILRVWTVVDWCQFTGANAAGKWGPYTQIIKLHNTDKPIFETICTDTSFCAYSADCKTGLVTLSADASDPCTENKDLLWTYGIDIDKDGIIDLTGNKNTFSGDLPLGNHLIKWEVADQCGNSEKCIRNFSVVDCKKPTPYCLTSVTMSLDEISGSAEIWAKDFDRGSFDNCTAVSELTFTFNGQLPVQSLIGVEHYFKDNGILSNKQEYESGISQKWLPGTFSAGLYFDCQQIADGISDTIKLDMTVTDKNGNQDFCPVILILQDNADHCTDIVSSASISGTIRTEYNKIPKGVEVFYESQEINGSKISDESTGIYHLEDLPLLKDYTIRPHLNSDPLQGVTTFDLVLIQRHILGISVFDSPYKVVASDINSSKSITASDLVELRKLILGITNKFPKDLPSWIFVAKDGGIKNNLYPFEYTNFIESGSLEKDKESLDFISVKIGDVNHSALNVNGGNIETRSGTHHELTINYSKEILDGEPYLVFRSTEDIFLDGMQVFCKIENGQHMSVSLTKDLKHGMTSDIHIGEDCLNFLLYHSEGVEIKRNEILYIVRLDDDIDLNQIGLVSTKSSEIYSNGAVRKILLKQRLQKTTEKISLITNPVLDDLRLELSGIEDKTNLTLTVFNTEGKAFLTSKIEYQEAKMDYTIKLPPSMPPGIYVCTVRSKTLNSTLKFIRIR